MRYLTNDLLDQAIKAEELLKRVETGSKNVFLFDILADIIWILEGYYKQNRGNIREWITTISNLQGLIFSDKYIALNALDIYADKKVDWSGAFVASQMLQLISTLTGLMVLPE